MLKRLSVLLLVLLVSVSAGVVYAFWDSLIVTKNATITIGEGVTLDVAVTAEVPLGKVLVPAGVILKDGDVEEIVLKYNVKLNQAASDSLKLVVVESDVKIGNSTDFTNLVNIEIDQGATIVNASIVEVIVTVTLIEPDDVGTTTAEAIYAAIKGKDITFTLTFTASKVVTP